MNNRPNECALALTIPLTREKFLHNLHHPAKSDFVPSWAARKGALNDSSMWDLYCQEIVEPAGVVCKAVKEFGVAVFTDVSLACFKQLLAQYKVVALFAHQRTAKHGKTGTDQPKGNPVSENQIEFADQLHAIHDVVRVIPNHYTGVIDFQVCNSIYIGDEIKRRQRKCTIMVGQHLGELRVRLHMYRFTIQLMAEQDVDYQHASMILRREFLKNQKG